MPSPVAFRLLQRNRLNFKQNKHVEGYGRHYSDRGSTPLISTKRELSEHHYHRTVGSGSFFIAAEGIGLPYKSQANQFVLIAPQSIYGDYLLKKQTTFLMSTTATEHTIFVYHSK